MVRSGSTLSKKAALKALVQISAGQTNSKILVEAGIIKIIIKEMSTSQIHNETTDFTVDAAKILANIFESGIQIELLEVNTAGQRATLDYIVYNIVCFLKNSSLEELNRNLMRILLSLTKGPKSMSILVSVITDAKASYIFLELTNTAHEELVISALKLLISLSPYIGNLLADALCKGKGKLENLIQITDEIAQITEKQAVSAKFLAKLPHQNLTLNMALLDKSSPATILRTLHTIQSSGRTRSSRHASMYSEGLVGILVRYTATLYDPQILSLAKAHNFTSVFTELLDKAPSDEVQRLAAIGLQNLSLESPNLSKPPHHVKRTSSSKWFGSSKFPSFNSSKKRVTTCPVHKGDCSSEKTFCLVEANAVGRLLTCLNHENIKVVEAALSAVCTLLDDKVDVGKSVIILEEAHAIEHVLKLIKEHEEEGLQQKCFWVIDKFISRGRDTTIHDISQDKMLPSILVGAFHHGAGNTKRMAEKVLRHLNRMPKFPPISG